jgi:hypothetical protein
MERGTGNCRGGRHVIPQQEEPTDRFRGTVILWHGRSVGPQCNYPPRRGMTGQQNGSVQIHVVRNVFRGTGNRPKGRQWNTQSIENATDSQRATREFHGTRRKGERQGFHIRESSCPGIVDTEQIAVGICHVTPIYSPGIVWGGFPPVPIGTVIRESPHNPDESRIKYQIVKDHYREIISREL